MKTKCYMCSKEIKPKHKKIKVGINHIAHTVCKSCFDIFLVLKNMKKYLAFIFKKGILINEHKIHC